MRDGYFPHELIIAVDDEGDVCWSAKTWEDARKLYDEKCKWHHFTILLLTGREGGFTGGVDITSLITKDVYR